MKTLPLENKRTNTVSFFVPSEWLWYGCGGGGGVLEFSSVVMHAFWVQCRVP